MYNNSVQSTYFVKGVYFMAKRTAKDFSRSKIGEIATQYAETPESYSHTFFEKEYEISQTTFYTILEKAVIENVVSNETVLEMAGKASSNSSEKAGEPGETRSAKHYKYLIQKRKIYMLPKKEAIDLADRYSKSKLRKKEFAEKYYYTTALMDRTIMKCIIDCWIKDETVSLLKNKALQQHKSEEAIRFWDKLEEMRTNKKSQG